MRKHFLPVLLVLLLVLLAGCSQTSELPKYTEISSSSVGEFSELKQDKYLTDEPSIFLTETTASSPENQVVTESTESRENKDTEPTTSSVSKPSDVTEKALETSETKPNQEQTKKPEPEKQPTETSLPVTKPAETEQQPTEPIQTEPPAEFKPQGFTQADHDRIIAEVKTYAESYTAKGYTYIWKSDMPFSDDVGYMGTPRIKRDGVEGVISILKHHIDLIYKTTTDPSNGITCDEMTYRVMQVDLDGEIGFVVVYGG